MGSAEMHRERLTHGHFCTPGDYPRPPRREYIRRELYTMNRGNLFNRRIRHWHDSADHLQATMREQATSLADQTREGLVKGQKIMEDWEKTMEDSVREKPMFFLGIAVGFLGLASLLTAGFLLIRKR
jgi:hypothetical protein